MSNDAVENRIDPKILEEAAEYYLSLQDDSMSGAELKAWQAWFMRSPDHQTAFKRLESLWGALEHVSADDFKAIEPPFDNESAAAVSSASVIGMIAPQEKPVAASSGMRWFTGIAASFAAVMIAGNMALTPAGVGPNPINEVPYLTAAGEQRVVHLSDGSILELGPDSAVTVGYTPTERALELVRGQAIFTVSKNPNRPFVVRAGSGSVTAIGTVFNVRRMDEDVRVRVLEGTVAVRPTSENEGAEPVEGNSQPVALVSAGNQTLYGDEGTMTPVEEADVHADLAWRVGVLTMVNRELSDVIQELNRFVQNEIAIGDNAIGKFHFTGTVYPDKVDEWLEGLTQGYPLKVVRVGGRTILMLDDSAASH